MTETFTASNGVVLDVDGGAIHKDAVMTVKGEFKDALREFFQYERDQELGRWRDPENLARVAYPTSPQTVFIMDESTGQGAEYSRQTANDSSANYGDRLKRQSARAYFAAHPAPEPWHDAKPGEVWLLTFLSGEQMIGLVDHDGECFIGGGQELTVIKSTAFTDGRRIWPEVPSE